MTTKFKFFYKYQVYYNIQVSTQGNMSQCESTWFNRNQLESDTNQHEFDIWRIAFVKGFIFFSNLHAVVP